MNRSQRFDRLGRARRTACNLAVRLVVGSTLLGIVATPLQAGGLNAEMQSFFSSMGGMSTSTSPGAYKGQGANVYMGGELQVRYPVRTYQLVSYSLPSIKAGCGGIDAYLGSFSHINSAGFKDMLTQIGNATIGLLFKSALAAINPLIESKLSELGMDVKMEGIFSRNSCQMAQSLVNGMSGITGMSSDSACVAMAQKLYGDDDAAARRRCKTDATSVNSDARSSGDDDAKNLAKRDTNLIWRALENSSLSKDDKELLINIAGSVLIHAPLANGGAAKGPTYLQPSIDSIGLLMNGDADASTPGQVRITNYWKCPDADCMQPVQEPLDFQPFNLKIATRLHAISDKLANRQRLSQDDINFISMTSVPVLKMLTLGYQAGPNIGESVQELYIQRFSNIIALDYAHGFLSQTIKNARVYLNSADQIGEAEAREAANVRRNLDDRLAGLDRERNQALARIGNVDAIVTHLERVERQMRQNIGGPLRTMLDFGQLMSGKGSQG